MEYEGDFQEHLGREVLCKLQMELTVSSHSKAKAQAVPKEAESSL